MEELNDWTHLSYERLESYADGVLDEIDREIVEAHTRICPLCATELNDLIRFRQEHVADALPDKRVRSRFSKAWQRLGQPKWYPSRLALPVPGYIAATGWVVAVASVAYCVVLVGKMDEVRQQEARAQRSQAETVANLKADLQQERRLRTAREMQQSQRIAAMAKPMAQLQAELAELTRDNQRLRAESAARTAKLAVASPPSPAWRVLLDTARATTVAADLVIPDLRRLTTLSSVMRGTAETTNPPQFTLTAPVGTRVLSDRPAFTWHPCPGAVRYTVLIATVDDNVLAKTEMPVLETHWTVPRNVSLPRDQVLLWEVQARDRNDKEISGTTEGRFEVITAKRAAVITEAAAHMEKTSLDRAALYAQAGLLDDADRAVADFLNQSPSELSSEQRARGLRFQETLQAARHLSEEQPETLP